MKILVAGGAGYIGSHTAVTLVHAGHDVVIADNYVNSKPESVRRIRELCGREIAFARCDLCDLDALGDVFARYPIDAVIHFAGLKAVGESIEQPLRYYHNNLVSTLNLLSCMRDYGVRKLVFSSSATVYGEPKKVPILENFPTAAKSPYGATKVMIEQILRDVAGESPDMGIVMLRYFNPIGAHPSGRIGEDPNGIPNNLLPYIAQVASGKLAHVTVFGDDYDTPDGTCIRDYIHVVDLAEGHTAALEKLEKGAGLSIYNLGTGKGYSVLEMIAAFETACGTPIPFTVSGRRAGDAAVLCADASLAEAELGWKARRTVAEMCADSWNFQRSNPDGYPD